MMLLEVHLQDFRQVVVLDGSREQDLEGIRQEGDRVMLAEKAGELAKQLAGFGIFDMRLDADETFLPRRVEDRVQDLQELRVRVFGERAGLE